MAVKSFQVGDRVKLRVKRYARESGAQGVVRFAFESAAGCLIAFDKQPRDSFVWANLLEREEGMLRARSVGTAD
jgi:hypothetical protein